jgi:tRNA dimethylallyltransferase
VAGGTGFYLRALFEGLFAEPVLDPVRRARLRVALRGLGARVADAPAGAGRRSRMTREARAELDRWAARLDPGFAGGGAQRAARVVEVALLAGRRLSALHRATPAAPTGLRPWYAVLTLPRDRLAERIRARAEAMVAAGLVDEVRRLLAAGLPKDAPGLDAVGYREVLAVLEGALPIEGLAAAIATATRQYAKRQLTWLRHQLRGPALWLDASGAPGALAEQVLAGYRAAD